MFHGKPTKPIVEEVLVILTLLFLLFQIQHQLVWRAELFVYQLKYIIHFIAHSTFSAYYLLE